MLDCEVCPHFKIGYVPGDCFECEFLKVRMRVAAVGIQETRREEKEKEYAAADERARKAEEEKRTAAWIIKRPKEARYCLTCERKADEPGQPGYCSRDCHAKLLYILAAILAGGDSRIAYRIFDAKETCFTCQSSARINYCGKGHRIARRELGFCEDWQRIAQAAARPVDL